MDGHPLYRAPRSANALGVLLVAALLVIILNPGGESPATAQSTPAGKTVTALGLGQVKVDPQDRHSNASIVAAVEAAEAKAVPQAITEARDRAAALAKASGLEVGAIESVDETPQSPFFYVGGPNAYPAPFGKDKYCGDERRPTFKRNAAGRRVVSGSHVVHACRVPRFVLINLSVKFSAG
jgi:uncharacterized protein YggE